MNTPDTANGKNQNQRKKNEQKKSSVPSKPSKVRDEKTAQQMLRDMTEEQLWEIAGNCQDPRQGNAAQALYLKYSAEAKKAGLEAKIWGGISNSGIWVAERAHWIPGVGVGYNSYVGIYVTITGDVETYNYKGLSADEYYKDWRKKQGISALSSVAGAGAAKFAPAVGRYVAQKAGEFVASTKIVEEVADDLANTPRSPKGLIGKAFEDFLQEYFGGRGSFKVSGREFDGAYGDVWYEAKSGEYWDMLIDNLWQLQKFKSDIGEHLSIALKNGFRFELHSNTPIPEFIKEWLIKKGIPFFEWLD